MSKTSAKIRPPSLNSDPRLEKIHALLKKVEAHLRLQDAARLLPFAGGGVAAVLVLLAVLWRFGNAFSFASLLAIGAGTLALGVLGVALYALLKPRDLLDTARRADHLLGLDERLSTALEDASTPPARPTPDLLSLREAQLEDTLASIVGIRPERAMPVKFDVRGMLPSGILALVMLLVIFTSGFTGSNPNKATQPQIAAEQKNIEVLKQAIESQPNVAQDPILQKLLEEINALSSDLKEGDLTSEEALARLSQAEAELRKTLNPQAQARREALDQMAKQLAASGSDAARQAGEALKAGDPQKAADALKKAAQDAAKMTPEERKALADALRKARDSAAALDPELASRLNEAANALESGDPTAAQQVLENLAQQVQENTQQLATQKQLEQALAQIQQSKSNIAQAGQPTPASGSGTAVANTAPTSGTPSANGTSVSGSGTASAGGSPVSGTPIALGSRTVVKVSGTVVAGSTATAGTPVVMQGTPGQGTPVVAQGQGQGQSSGQSQGQGQTQGQGQGQGQGQSANGSPGGQPSGGWGTGHNEQVYSPPSSVNATTTPLTVQGQDNPNGEQSSTTTNTNANQTGPSTVPYEQIYGQYQQQAGDALNSDYIPQGYKDLVKDYFTDIAP